MEKVTTKLLSDLIDESIKNGISRSVEIEDSDIAYLRMLLSRYNKVNGTKIIARKISSVNWVISAPFNRFIDDERWKRTFELIQSVMMNPDASLSEVNFKRIDVDLNTIIEMCKNRQANDKLGHDILK